MMRKGRSQYVYNKKYTQSQSYKKFDKNDIIR